MRRRVASFALLLALGLASAAEAQSLKALQREFLEIAKDVVPATVVVRAVDADARIVGSTGVVIHKDGWVLTDSAGPLKNMAEGKRTYATEVEVRLPHPDRRRFRARVVLRDDTNDFAIVRIIDPPRRLPVCPVGSSDALEVGAFSYVCGNAFGSGNEGKPALSAGLISGLITADETETGKYRQLYTSAKVNPGNNGGPLVDLEGRIVGIVSTFDRDPKSPYRAFGLVTPIDRIRALAAKVSETRAAIPPMNEKARAKMNDSRTLERAIQILARRAATRLVSLEVDRGEHVETIDVRYGRPPKVRVVKLPRYPGPYSAFCWDDEGHLVTAASSLYAPDKIKKITAVLPDGRVLEAKLLAHDAFRDVALLKIEAQEPLPVFEPAAKKDLEPGAFLLALGQPFGQLRHAGPWVTFGVLSRENQLGPVIDGIQTDAGLNEATAGGPVIDFEGKLVGMGILVTPDRFGRNSGIGFAVPHASIAAVIETLKSGRSLTPGYFGIRGGFPKNEAGDTVAGEVEKTGPAFAAGLRTGDVIVEFDGTAVDDYPDMMKMIERIKIKPAGSTIVVVVERDRKKLTLEIVLTARP